MGWLWSDSKPSAVKPPPPAPKNEHVSESQSAQEAIPPTESSKPPTRDELADRELSDFLKQIEAESTTQKKPPVYIRRPKPSSSPSPSPSGDLPIAEHLLPTTMSCRAAFDSAFYCNSLGGQFNAVYRNGSMGQCSEHWDDFWFCMRTRTYGGQAKEKAIRDYHREKERRRYGRDEEGRRKESSEDVWKSRERLVELGSEMRQPWPENLSSN